MAEKCPCQTYEKSCCACVSMHCDECHGHSEFVQGRFCSNCGRPLKAEITRLYVPKSEVDEIIGAFDTWLYKHYNGDISDWDLYKLFAELKKEMKGGK